MYGSNLWNQAPGSRVRSWGRCKLIANVAGQFENPSKGDARGQTTTRAGSLLSSAERQRLLVDWNRTGTDYPRTRCVHELFEEEAHAHPDASAATYRTSHISYGDLNARANQLANYLKSK